MTCNMSVRYGKKSRNVTSRSLATLERKSSASMVCCTQAVPMVRTLRLELRSLSMSGVSNAGVGSVKPSPIFPASTRLFRGSHHQSEGKNGMPWIKVDGEEEATGELREIYQTQAKKAGALANILKIHSLAPGTLSTHMALYEAVMHAPGDLSRIQREMIAVVVSSL